MDIDWSNPTIAAVAGGLVGAILVALLSFVVAKIVKEKKTVTVVRFQDRNLIAERTILADRLKVSVDDNAVDNISVCKFSILNTGTTAINNLNVAFSAENGSRIVHYEVVSKRKNVKSTDIIYVRNTNFCEFTILYINPGEHFDCEVNLIGPGTLAQISARNPDVTEKYVTESDFRADFAERLLESSFRVMGVSIPLRGVFSRIFRK